MKHKKTQYLLFITIIILAFSTEVSAKWCVVCMDGYGCMAINAGCGDFSRPKKSTCRDLLRFNPTDHLNREKGGSASFTIDGVKIPIASDAIELFLMRNAGDRPTQSASNAKGIDIYLVIKDENELKKLLQTDRGGVSDARLNQFSHEFGIPIHRDEIDLDSWSFTTIDFFDNNGKLGFTTTTDDKGNFFFQKISDGPCKVKVSKRIGNMPKQGNMLINGIGDIVCCCPGPPCEDAPLTFIVGKETPSVLKRGQHFLKTASNYSGSIK